VTGKAAPVIERLIRFGLTLPVTRFGVGPFQFDAVEHAIGAPVVELLASLMTGPVQRRPSAAGPAIDVYPLALPEGEGLSVPLGPFGELGFKNDGGLLELTVPLRAEAWILGRVPSAVARGPERGLSLDGTARVSRLWLQLDPGMRAAVPLGTLGEIGIEAG
jgi:hypothetical protein